MLAKLRRKTRAQAQTEPVFGQSKWGGGQNTDDPASKIKPTELAGLTNAIDMGEYIEGHDGSLRLSSTALPGSGTVYSYDFHPTAKKWLLHRGSDLWTADAAMTSWTQVTSISFPGGITPTIASDTGAHFSSPYIIGANSSNSNAGVVYWNYTNSAGTRTLSIYKDLAKTQLVAQGTTTGANPIYASQRNNSGLQYSSFQGYTGDDTDAGNTFTASPITVGFRSSQSTIKKYKNDFVLFISSNSAYSPITYVNLTDNKFYLLGAVSGLGFPNLNISNVGAQTAATPYGRRYTFTFSRIVGLNDSVDVTKNRTTGILKFESAAVDALQSGGSSPALDYGEHWLANPIASGTPNTVSLAGGAGNFTVAVTRSDHYTHLSLYATLDIGSAGIDPSTGLGNNRELYVWVDDIDITVASYSDAIPDDILRARLDRFGLRSRFWQPLPGGACGCIVNDFIFQAGRGDPKVYYGQLLRPEFMGFYRPDAQFMTFDDGVQVLAESVEQVAVICSRQTWKINPKINSNIDQIGSVFVINSKLPTSRTIGVTDWGSVQPIENGGFIARCSDGSIRIWGGGGVVNAYGVPSSSYWGEDLTDNRIRKTSLTMIDGSASAYSKNAYYLWYRTASGDFNNTKCFRLGLGGDAGFGWSTIARASWIFPYLRMGAVLMLDSANLARLMVLDYATGNFYWIETFTNADSSFTQAWKDKENVSGGTDIAATIRLREFTGERENHTLYHGESHAYFRPAIPADGYLTGFQVGLNIYANGGAAAVASQSNAPRDGDIQLSKVATGRRLQAEITTTTSKFQLTGYDSDIVEQDKATIGSKFSDTDEAAYQLALASNLILLLTRPLNLMNRAAGINFTLVGAAPTNIAGPDGKAYALAFSTTVPIPYDYPFVTNLGDFSAHFWVKNGPDVANIITVKGAVNSLTMRFNNATTLRVALAGGTVSLITVNTIAAGWHDFWVIRSGTTLLIYQNGALISSTTVTGTLQDCTNIRINDFGFTVNMYDLRLYTSVISAAAIAYYYDDVLNNAGKRLLPLA